MSVILTDVIENSWSEKSTKMICNYYNWSNHMLIGIKSKIAISN